jgi:hypoxanthine-guanine phosphoribosyltransferase
VRESLNVLIVPTMMYTGMPLDVLLTTSLIALAQIHFVRLLKNSHPLKVNIRTDAIGLKVDYEYPILLAHIEAHSV